MVAAQRRRHEEEDKMMHQGKQRSVPEIMIELREDDPEMKQVIAAHSFRAGQTIAEPEQLGMQSVHVDEGPSAVDSRRAERASPGDCHVGAGGDVRRRRAVGRVRAVNQGGRVDRLCGVDGSRTPCAGAGDALSGAELGAVADGRAAARPGGRSDGRGRL